MKQCYCISTVQASRISGRAHEQKLVIERSREETEERNCSEVCLLHPEAPLIHNVICWETTSAVEPCLAWVVALMGLISSHSFVSWSTQVVLSELLMALEAVKPIETPRSYFFSLLWCIGIKWNSGKNWKPNMWTPSKTIKSQEFRIYSLWHCWRVYKLKNSMKTAANLPICMSFKQRCTCYFSHAEYCLKQGSFHIACFFF